jgi:hypothetical protein
LSPSSEDLFGGYADRDDPADVLRTFECRPCRQASEDVPAKRRAALALRDEVGPVTGKAAGDFEGFGVHADTVRRAPPTTKSSVGSARRIDEMAKQ